MVCICIGKYTGFGWYVDWFSHGLRVRVCLCIEVHKWGWRCRLIKIGATIWIILEVLGSIQGLVGMWTGFPWLRGPGSGGPGFEG